MTEHYADPFAGLTGLLFFFVFFLGALIWLYRPGAREIYKKLGNIPLKDSNDD